MIPFGPNDPTWLDNPALTTQLLPAVRDTLYMVFSSGILTVLFGLPLGLLLVSSSPAGLRPRPALNRAVGLIVNIGRSFPFIILIIAIQPFTRLLVGTTLGWKAVVVPLTIGAIPFFARLVETNIASIHPGKIEAAQMMGASHLRIQWGVQVREALPQLVQSTTVLLITLVGYSAMAGAVGGGGLGQMAINYGYVRYQNDVMLVTVVLIIILVQAIQMVGDMISRLVDHR
ncbi:methionine ABC transporter permease [Actinomyces sp. F1_1611]